MKEGVDPRLGVYMHVPAEIRAAMPDPAKITVADAERAYGFLADKWLVDVDGDDNAKAGLISIDLTIIQRPLFDQRPGYMVTAPQPGTGKTTVIHMGSLARDRAQARGGVGEPRGGNPQIPVQLPQRRNRASGVGQHQTRRQDIQPARGKGADERGLRGSDTRTERGVESAANRVQVWTGNDIGPKGEMSNRVIVVRCARRAPTRRTGISSIPTRSPGRSITARRFCMRCTRSCAPPEHRA